MTRGAHSPDPSAARILSRTLNDSTSSEALNNATLPFGLALADHGLRFFSLLTRLNPGLRSLKPKLLLVWLLLFFRYLLCTIEKILASLRLCVVVI